MAIELPPDNHSTHWLVWVFCLVMLLICAWLAYRRYACVFTYGLVNKKFLQPRSLPKTIWHCVVVLLACNGFRRGLSSSSSLRLGVIKHEVGHLFCLAFVTSKLGLDKVETLKLLIGQKYLVEGGLYFNLFKEESVNRTAYLITLAGGYAAESTHRLKYDPQQEIIFGFGSRRDINEWQEVSKGLPAKDAIKAWYEAVEIAKSHILDNQALFTETVNQLDKTGLHELSDGEIRRILSLVKCSDNTIARQQALNDTISNQFRSDPRQNSAAIRTEQ